jgi:ABC-type Zn2+ transport system substrate-binding protein/surface adhesin
LQTLYILIPYLATHPFPSNNHQHHNETHIHTMTDINPETAVTLEVRGKMAIITMCNEKKLNAMTQDLYFRLSQLMREVAKMDDVFVTVLTAKGRFFSA